MIVAGLALFTSLTGIAVGGGVLGGVLGWFSSPGVGAARLMLSVIRKLPVGEPLPPEKAAWLKRYNEAMRTPMTKAQFNKYVYGNKT